MYKPSGHQFHNVMQIEKCHSDELCNMCKLGSLGVPRCRRVNVFNAQKRMKPPILSSPTRKDGHIPTIMFKRFCFGLLALNIFLSLQALELPRVFSDHMVLQQELPIPVWGKAESGKTVTVTFKNQTVSAEVSDEGLWGITLEPEKASFEPATFLVSDGENTFEYEDVLVGEVWLCSGQSNMDWSISQSGEADIETLAGNHPEIRLYRVDRKIADEPRFSANVEWRLCSPGSLPSFSAVGYSFGRDLRQVLDVPVGLIHSAWGGTPAIS